MSKRILSLISVVIFFCVPLLAQKISESQRDELAGSVKTVIIWEFDKEKNLLGITGGEPVLSSLVTYDLKGNKVETIHYNNSGKYLWRWTSEFRADGKSTRFVTYHDDFSINETFVMRYDHNGRKVSEVKYKDEKLTLSGRKLYRTLKREGALEETTYDLRGRPVFRRITTCDSAGNEIEVSEHTTEYGSFRGHGADRWTYKYNSSGYLTEWHFFEGKRFMGKYEYMRDTRGNLIEERSFDKNNQLERTINFTYEFDVRGNWIKRTARPVSEAGQQKFPNVFKITNRQIVYF